MDSVQGHLVDVCSLLSLPATVLLSTLSTPCELSHDWPPDSTSFSVAPQTTSPCRATNRRGQVVSLS